LPRWLLIQTFHCRLTQKARESLDAFAEGSLFELTLGEAELLLDKIAKDQSWFQDKVQHHHQTEEILEKDQRTIEAAIKHLNNQGMKSGNFKQPTLIEIIPQEQYNYKKREIHQRTPSEEEPLETPPPEEGNSED
jgi:hypothetical protein